MLVEVRLAYSHMVVLDSFFDETEREALLSQLTESGWAHAQVSIHQYLDCPRPVSRGCSEVLPQRIAKTLFRRLTGVTMAVVD